VDLGSPEGVHRHHEGQTRAEFLLPSAESRPGGASRRLWRNPTHGGLWPSVNQTCFPAGACNKTQLFRATKACQEPRSCNGALHHLADQGSGLSSLHRSLDLERGNQFNTYPEDAPGNSLGCPSLPTNTPTPPRPRASSSAILITGSSLRRLVPDTKWDDQ